MEKLYIPTQTEYEKAKAETRSAYAHIFIVPTCESEIPSVEQLKLCGGKNLQFLDVFLDQRQQALEEERAQIQGILKGSFSDNLDAEPLCCTLGHPEWGRLGQSCINCCPVARRLHKQAFDESGERIRSLLPQEGVEVLSHLDEGKAVIDEILRELASKTPCALGSSEHHVALLNNLDQRFRYLTDACNALTLYRARLKEVPQLDLPIFIDNRNIRWIPASNGSNKNDMCYFVTPEDTGKIDKIRDLSPSFKVGKHGEFLTGFLYPTEDKDRYTFASPNLNEFQRELWDVNICDPFLMRADELEMLTAHPEAVGMWAETRNYPQDVDLAKLQPLYNYFHSLGGK